jgi:acetyl-CoA carboxylase biotin carboxylase subunit
MRGAAIECRVYAEDPENNFLPCPGRITSFVEPQGPGVRNDSGVYEGWEVPVHYDPLLAKLCVWAERRETAIDRLARSLDEYTIGGIRTTLPLFRAVVQDGEFRRGNFDTEFIDRFLERQSEIEDGRRADIAAIAAVLHARANSSKPSMESPAVTEGRWKLYGRLSQRR